MSLIYLPGNPPPGNLITGYLQSPDDVTLRYMIASPKGPPRASVIVLQGRGDFLERYFETFRDLNDRGFVAAGFDWRGQGGSERLDPDPSVASISDFSLYERDLDGFLAMLESQQWPKPWYVLSHSMGGCIMLRALRKQSPFVRAITTSPMLDVKTGKWPKALAHGVARFLRLIGLSRRPAPGRPVRRAGPEDFEGNAFTSDVLRYDRDQRILASAPQLSIGPISIGWTDAAFRAMNSLRKIKAGKSLACPTLIVAAGRERITETEACREFARRIANVSCVVIDDANHEILMERDLLRAQFWAAFDSFITDHAPMRVKASA